MLNKERGTRERGGKKSKLQNEARKRVVAGEKRADYTEDLLKFFFPMFFQTSTFFPPKRSSLYPNNLNSPIV